MTSAKKTVVMGFGTFDAIHPGHIDYLRQLKSLGDELIVVIARDRNVERIKGQRPHFGEEERSNAIEQTGLADRVVLGNPDDFFKVLRDFCPDVIGLGYDQRVDEASIREAFPHIHIKRLKAHHPKKFKSSLIKKQLFG